MHLHAATLLVTSAFYGLLLLAGLGPVLLLLGRRTGAVRLVAFAPVVGLALALLAGTFAVQLDLPLQSAALPLSAGLLGLSLLCAFAALRLDRADGPSDTGTVPALRPYLWLLGAAAVLLLAPVLVGGPHTTTLRGNLYDDLNYIIGARYVEFHPLSWQAAASQADLLHVDPSFLLVKRFLWSERTPVLALLAWCARLVSRPVADVEFAFTLVFFLIAVGPAYLLCLDLGATPLVRFLAPFAVACGFWGQIVLDLRAMGQIVNLPLSLGVCWIASGLLARRPGATSPAGIVLFALLLGSAALSYPEMVPSLAWGLGGAFLLALPGGHLDRAAVRAWGLALLGALLVLASQEVFFWRLLLRQLYVSVVRASAMSWQGDWFRFLQTPAPLAGHWGLAWGPLCGTGAWTLASTALAVLLSVALALTLVRALFDAFRKGAAGRLTNDPLLATSFMLAVFSSGFLAQDLVMRLLGNPWAGAKALSYGYPYVILLVAGFASRSDVGTGVTKFLRQTLRGAALVWLLSQSAFALFHLAQARSGSTYFVCGEPSHRSSASVGYDPAWQSFQKPLALTRGAVVWSFQPLVWESELFNVSFGDHLHLLPLLSVDHYETGYLIDRPDIASLPLPRFLLVDRQFWGETLNPGETIVHQTSHTRLIRLPADAWRHTTLLGILPTNSSSLLRGAAASSATIPCELWVYSPAPTLLGLNIDASAPETLVLRSPQAGRILWRGLVHQGSQLRVPILAGLNVVQIQTLGSGVRLNLKTPLTEAANKEGRAKIDSPNR